MSIAISLTFKLNLLEENKEYNINEFKFLKDVDQHWVTIQKYITIFNLIQKYCPKIELKDSKLKILHSKLYNYLTEKEKFIIHLFNNKAIDSSNTIPLNKDFDYSEISNSIGYLYKKTEENRFYLTKSGIDVYKSIKHSVSELIHNQKEFSEIFGEIKEKFEYEEPIEENYVVIEVVGEPSEIFYKSVQEVSFAVAQFSPYLSGTSKDKMVIYRERSLSDSFQEIDLIKR